MHHFQFDDACTALTSCTILHHTNSSPKLFFTLQKPGKKGIAGDISTVVRVQIPTGPLEQTPVLFDW